MNFTLLLQLRILVGFLGEQAQNNWWPSSFYSSTSKAFLEPIFNRTTVIAQYHGICGAAKKVHDEHVNLGTYHLFRLPENIEQQLHALLIENQTSISTLSLKNKEDALGQLKSLAKTTLEPAQDGPISLGSISNINTPESLQKLAAQYYQAFISSSNTFPYFTRIE